MLVSYMHQNPNGVTKAIADECSHALRCCTRRALQDVWELVSKQREVSRGSYCAKEGAQEGFPTNLVIPHPSGHNITAETHHLCLLLYKVCMLIPFPRIISETPQGSNWKTLHLQSNRPP